MIVTAIVSISYLIFFVCGVSISSLWYTYAFIYYENKKIGNVGIIIMMILGAIPTLLAIILDILCYYTGWKAIKYSLYEYDKQHHIKVPWLGKLHYVDTHTYFIYFYKLILFMIGSQYLFIILLPITLLIMKFFKSRRNLAVNN